MKCLKVKVLRFSACRQVACTNHVHFLVRKHNILVLLGTYCLLFEGEIVEVSIPEVYMVETSKLKIVCSTAYYSSFNRVTNCKMFVLVNESLKAYMPIYTVM